MFQNKKLKRNATSAIAEVAFCASNCALPTSGNAKLQIIIFGIFVSFALCHKITVFAISIQIS